MHAFRLSPVPVSLLLAFLTFSGIPKSLSADEASKAVWGLRSGDRFVVSVFVVKQTEATIDNKVSTTSDSRDRFEIEYRVAEVLKSGDALVLARLRKARRDTNESTSELLQQTAQSTRALEDVKIRFQIDPSGEISEISVRDREAAVATLSSLDPTAGRILRESCPDEIISSWFGRPFWFVRNAQNDKDKPQQEIEFPQRTDFLAVGPFGLIRTTIGVLASDDANEKDSLLISGTGRFAPLVVPEATQSSTMIPLSDVVAELDEFAGKARLANIEATGKPGQATGTGLRFQSMELNIRIHGTAKLLISAEGTSQELSFRQTQMQSWILTEHSFRRAPVEITIPVPDAPN